MSRYHHALRSVAGQRLQHVPSNLTIDEVGDFWVVTKPSDVSELCDILFKRTVAEIGLQFKGGLNAEDFLGVFTDEDRARVFALKQLP